MDALREELLEQLTLKTSFTIGLFGGIPVPQSVVVSWVIMAFLVGLSLFLTRKLDRIPKGPQLVAELFVGFIDRFSCDTLGAHGKAFAPYLGTVALYIGCANIIGIFGLSPPTRDLNVTAGLSLMSAALIYGASFRFHGLRGGLHKFLEPMAVVAPINVMEIVIRPLSLCMRLFGNVLGAFIVMELVKDLVPMLIPIPLSLYFDIFDGIIQTIVFVFLTALFAKESLE